MYVYRRDENSFSMGGRGDGIIATPDSMGLMHICIGRTIANIYGRTQTFVCEINKSSYSKNNEYCIPADIRYTMLHLVHGAMVLPYGY